MKSLHTPLCCWVWFQLPARAEDSGSLPLLWVYSPKTNLYYTPFQAIIELFSMTTEVLSLEHRNINHLQSDVSQMLVMQKWKRQSLPVDNLLTFRLVTETWYLVYNLWLLWCLFLIVNLNTAGTKTQETAYICEWFEVERPTLDLDLLRWEDLPKSGSYLLAETFTMEVEEGCPCSACLS